MPGKPPHQISLVLVGLLGASSVRAQVVPIRVKPQNPISLIRLSRSSEREQWWPAVEQLGRLAAADDAARNEVWSRAKVNTLGMKFVEVKPGRFIQGSDVYGRGGAEAHSVELTTGYYIGVTEVTNTQFQRLFPEFEVDPRSSPDPDSPAVNVTWKEADRFCRLLSEREGALYRLPTEAEWEYACRAGTTTRFSFGDHPSVLAQYGWCGDKDGRTSRVALLRPNAWGLYDMHGNALEWVSDLFSYTYYTECASKGVVIDPKGPTRGWSHVLRGGAAIAGYTGACSSTARFLLPLLDRFPFSGDEVGFRQVVGFRVVRESNHSEGEGRSMNSMVAPASPDRN